MKVLVTGGAGYLGSHTCVALTEAGHEVVVLDNLSNGSSSALERAEKISGARIGFVQGDVRDPKAVASALGGGVDAVLHFAALKSIGDSWLEPLEYFDNNVSGTMCLLNGMARAGVRKLVFSSSATVYGEPESIPVAESAKLGATNPYGRTKLMAEELVRAVSEGQGRCQFDSVLLRYFNPVGAHPGGTLGESPRSTPTNLVPYITQVAVGREKLLHVYGNDYPTPDGTGIRDYIHVMDLASAHVRALDFIAQREGSHVFNLGTGRGYSVMEVLTTFQLVSNRRIPYKVVGRRPGDIPAVWADAALAERELRWRANFSLEQMCEDAWRWQSMNPTGLDS